MIRFIAALDSQNGIADDHGIPWQGKVPSDAKYFREQTLTGLILMGRSTYEEFEAPLAGRQNFVATHYAMPLRHGFTSIQDVSLFLHEHHNEPVWVIGGAKLFAETLHLADELYLTRIDHDFHCTKFFPKFEDKFMLQSRSTPLAENGLTLHFEVWQRK